MVPRLGSRLLIVATLACVLGATVSLGAAPASATPAPGLTPSCDAIDLTLYTDANLSKAIAVANCWLGGITQGEAQLPRLAQGQATACSKVKASGQALAWVAIKELEKSDDESLFAIEDVNNTLDGLARFFGKFFDKTITNTPQTARIAAFDDEKLLAAVVAANGDAHGVGTQLPHHMGFSGDQGVTLALTELASNLGAHDCSGASRSANKLTSEYAKAKAAAVAFTAGAKT
jgi:hypothetical protein